MRGTVAANVALGDPEPDADRIRVALDDACAEGIDPALELGVQSSGLSGGQRSASLSPERCTVSRPARAGCSRSTSPRVLSTRHEDRLWRSLRARADAGASILLVSHRRTARDIADHVVVLGVNA